MQRKPKIDYPIEYNYIISVAPKTDKNVLMEVKAIYQSGAYKSIRELAERYGINHHTLRNRIANESWDVKRRELMVKVSEKVEGQVISEAETYLLSLRSRMSKYSQIIDASIENHGAKTAEGIPLLDPEAIDQYTRSETRIKDINAFAYRIPTLSQQDLTTKGQPISLVSVIAQLRETNTSVNISDEDHAKLMQLEIEPKKSV